MATEYAKERIKRMRNYTPKTAEAFDQAAELIHKAETLLDDAIMVGIIYKDHLDKDDLGLNSIADIVGVHTRLEQCCEIMDKAWGSKKKEQTHA
ncbi:MAG: hypothetical protein [Caudoviricetes sp.]|nr:MAG: hypothetical protein [Caudoviricetes sp.]